MRIIIFFMSVILILAMLGAVGCGGSDHSNSSFYNYSYSEIDLSETYVDEESRYTIGYPLGWEVNDEEDDDGNGYILLHDGMDIRTSVGIFTYSIDAFGEDLVIDTLMTFLRMYCNNEEPQKTSFKEHKSYECPLEVDDVSGAIGGMLVVMTDEYIYNVWVVRSPKSAENVLHSIISSFEPIK